MQTPRIRFVDYQPSDITNIAFTPPEYPNPYVAVTRKNGNLEIWQPSLIPHPSRIPVTPPTNTSNTTDMDVVVGKEQFSIGPMMDTGRSNGSSVAAGGVHSWITHARIAGSPDESIESIVWALSEEEEEGDDDNKGNQQQQLKTIKPRLFCATLSGWILEYDVDTLKCTRKIDSSGGGTIWCMTTWDNRWLCVGCEDSAIRLYDISNDQLELVRVFEKQADQVLSICRAGENLICSGSCDGRVRFWDWKTGRCVGRVVVGGKSSSGSTSGFAKEMYVWSIVPVAGGSCIATADSMGFVKIWDCTTQTLVQSIKTHQADVLTLCANESGDLLFASGIDSKIVLLAYNQSFGQWFIKQNRRPHTHDVRALAWLQIRSRPQNSASRKRKSTSPAVEEESKEKGELLFDVMLSGGVDTMLTVHPVPEREFSNTSFQPVRLPHMPLQPIVQLSRENRILMSQLDQSIKLFQLGYADMKSKKWKVGDPLDEKPKFLAEIMVGTVTGGSSHAVNHNILTSCISPDGQLVFAANAIGDDFLYRVDVNTHEIVSFHNILDTHSPCQRCYFIDNDHLVVACQDYSVRVIKIDGNGFTQVSVTKLEEFTRNEKQAVATLTSLIASPCGKYVACADLLNRVFLIDVKNGKVKKLPQLSNCMHTTLSFARLPRRQTNEKDEKLVDCLIIPCSMAPASISPTTGKKSSYDDSLTFFFWDITADRLMTEYQSALDSIKWLHSRRQKVMQVHIVDGGMFINGFSWMTRVDLRRLMEIYGKYRKRGASVNEKVLMEMQECNKMTNEYEAVMFMGFVKGGDEMVVVERPWREVMAKFPPAFSYRRFNM